MECTKHPGARIRKLWWLEPTTDLMHAMVADGYVCTECEKPRMLELDAQSEPFSARIFRQAIFMLIRAKYRPSECIARMPIEKRAAVQEMRTVFTTMVDGIPPDLSTVMHKSTGGVPTVFDSSVLPHKIIFEHDGKPILEVINLV